MSDVLAFAIGGPVFVAAAIVACGPPPIGWQGAGRLQMLPEPEPDAVAPLSSGDTGATSTGDTGFDSGLDSELDSDLDSGSDSETDSATTPDATEDADDDGDTVDAHAGVKADGGKNEGGSGT